MRAKVKIKTWDEMESEFGDAEDGAIYFGAEWYPKELEELIPEDRGIEIRKQDDEDYIFSDYIIARWMIKEYL